MNLPPNKKPTRIIYEFSNGEQYQTRKMKIIQEDTKYFHIEKEEEGCIGIQQIATIHFKKKEKGVWEFGNCEFEVGPGNRSYSLQNWIFLGEVSKFIQDKLLELNQVNIRPSK